MQEKNAFQETEVLVAACLRNERRAQEVLYRTYFDKMMRMCMRYTSDREEALSIVNSGFLRVFQKLDKYSFKGSFEGWIRRLVFHCLSDHFRGKSKDVHFLEIMDSDFRASDSALSNLYVSDILDLVDQLPPATRDVFILYAIDGYKHEEIGQQLGISAGTSKWHLSTARKKLKTLLQQNKINYAG